MKVKLVYGLIIAGLLISQISLASSASQSEGPGVKTGCHPFSMAIDLSAQPYPSDSDSDPIEEGDNDPVKVYAC